MATLEERLIAKASVAPKPVQRPGGAWSMVEWATKARSGFYDQFPVCSPIMTTLARPMGKGNVVLVAGPAAGGKSFWVCQNLILWQKAGVPFAARFLEDDQPKYLRRVISQLATNADLSDGDAPLKCPTEWDSAWAEHQGFIQELGHSVEASDDGLVTYPMLLEWAHERVEQGCRILVIDPITAAAVTKPWEEDKHFLFQLKKIIADKATAMLITHPARDKENIAGSEAFRRFAHVILSLHNNVEKKTYWVKDRFGQVVEMQPPRLWKIEKSRDGPGTGFQVATNFAGIDTDTGKISLTFCDLGLVMPKPKNARPREDDDVF